MKVFFLVYSKKHSSSLTEDDVTLIVEPCASNELSSLIVANPG